MAYTYIVIRNKVLSSLGQSFMLDTYVYSSPVPWLALRQCQLYFRISSRDGGWLYLVGALDMR